MFKESVQLIAARRAAVACRLTNDIVGILSPELIRHHTPERIERIPLFRFVCIRRREVGTDQHRDVGIKGSVGIPTRFCQDVVYFFSEPLVLTVPLAAPLTCSCR